MHRTLRRPVRDPGLLATALLLGGAVCLLAAGSIELTRGAGRVAAVWPVNAVVVGILLRSPIRVWPAFLAAALAGNLAANLWMGDALARAIGLTACNGLEIAICAGWTRRALGPAFDPARRRHLAHFLLAGGLVAPMAAAVPAAIFLAGPLKSGAEQAASWFASDALGLLVITPLWALLAGAGLGGLRKELASWRGFGAAAGLSASLAAVYGQAWIADYFLIPSAVVLVAFVLRPVGVAAALALTGVVTVAGASLGWGAPVGGTGDLSGRLLHVQALLAVTTLSGLLVSTAVEARRRLETSLKDSIAQLEAARACAEASEARYRVVAENASDVIARTSVSGEGAYLSPSVEDVTGYSVEELLKNRPPFLPHLHPQDVAGTIAEYRALAGGDAASGRRAVRYRFRRRDGRWVWLESIPTLLRNAEGRPVEFIEVVRDVSAHVELEAALYAARAAAEAAAEVKARFIANMSHEIRNPLMAVLGFADLLATRQDLPVDAQKRIAQIQGAGRGLLAIANDVLDFSRLEAGEFAIRPGPCDATQLCLDTVSIFEAQAAAKGLQLELAIDGLPHELVLDGDRVRQILTNFIGNAIKFTEAGRVGLRASWRAGRLRLEVTDTGPGLSAQDQRRLFMRFSQVDGAPGRRHGGTGLGLAICKGLAEAMGGAVGVHSMPGAGSTFFAEIPCGGPSRASRDALGTAADTPGLSQPAIAGRRDRRPQARRDGSTRAREASPAPPAGGLQ